MMGRMKTTDIQLVASPSSTYPCRIVAADHPSLDRDIQAFLDHRSLARDSLVLALSERSGFRLAAIECDRVVGLARIDDGGELHIAVAVEHRGLGIATMLGRAALERAITLEYSRVLLRTRRRSRAARRVGEALGCIVVENARGRTDVIAHLPTGQRSA
jgi:RimJ/RimL family protein N-acetyltransferase